jgi:subtilase family serine protease
VSNGTCKGYPKPTYQSGALGNPADGVRDIPDVALFASNGWWNHYYLVCDSAPVSYTGGGVCESNPANWAGYGGTSVSTPIMAGIQALINQKKGGSQGNPNPRYYALAAAEYGSGGNASCNSSLGNAVGASCVFYDVTSGDMDVPCKADGRTGTFNCYLPSGTNGVLSTSNSAYQPAFKTGTGWDYATGLGSVNVWNLLNAY